MSEFIVLPLSRRLFPVLKSTFAAQHQIGKQQLSEAEVESSMQKLEKTIENKSVVTWLAFTKEQKLASYLVQHFVPSSKFWAMPLLGTNASLKMQWNYKTNGMDELWKRAFAFGKYHDHPGVVWSLPVGWDKTSERTRKTSTVWPKYHIESFARIPAGEMPTAQFDHLVFGDRVKPYDVILRAAWPQSASMLNQLEVERAKCSSSPAA